MGDEGVVEVDYEDNVDVGNNGEEDEDVDGTVQASAGLLHRGNSRLYCARGFPTNRCSELLKAIIALASVIHLKQTNFNHKKYNFKT